MINPLHLQAKHNELESVIHLFKELGNTTIVNKGVYKKCYSILCELADNLSHHVTPIYANESLLTVTFDANECNFYCKNVVSAKTKAVLQSRIDYINKSTNEHIQQAYKLIVKHSKSKEESTGLGLLLIKQKAQNELKYTFVPYKKPDCYLFELKIDLASTHEKSIDSSTKSSSLH